MVGPYLLGLVDGDVSGVVGQDASVLVDHAVQVEVVKVAGGSGAGTDSSPYRVAGTALVAGWIELGVHIVPKHERCNSVV